jgi:hypothetical protein
MRDVKELVKREFLNLDDLDYKVAKEGKQMGTSGKLSHGKRSE